MPYPVAPIRDRIVHRLLYEYLVEVFDITFTYDVWSCRKGKGLLAAINRTQYFLQKYPTAYVWRADIHKCFDSINHAILYNLISRKISDPKALHLIKTVISSYRVYPGTGVPIGNLTSQIFSNIFLNELDRFSQHNLKPTAYLRYGDDFLVFGELRSHVLSIREQTQYFLHHKLGLKLNKKNDTIIRPKHGLKFLGVVLWPSGRRLNKRNRKRIQVRLSSLNAAAYRGMVKKHEKGREERRLDWMILKNE